LTKSKIFKIEYFASSLRCSKATKLNSTFGLRSVGHIRHPVSGARLRHPWLWPCLHPRSR